MHSLENKTIDILIADDHPIVRNALKTLLTEQELSVVAVAESGQEVLDLLDHIACDLLILDMSMPGEPKGSELIKAIMRRSRSAAPILVFSMSDESGLISDALEAGAYGYITKDSDPEMILAAVKVVAARGRYISPALAQKVLLSQRRHSAAPPPRDLLSDREYQILLMLLDGKAVDEIAMDLFISRQTVSTHKSRLMHKLGLKNSVDLIRYAVRHGLIDP